MGRSLCVFIAIRSSNSVTSRGRISENIGVRDKRGDDSRDDNKVIEYKHDLRGRAVHLIKKKSVDRRLDILNNL